MYNPFLIGSVNTQPKSSAVYITIAQKLNDRFGHTKQALIHISLAILLSIVSFSTLGSQDKSDQRSTQETEHKKIKQQRQDFQKALSFITNNQTLKFNQALPDLVDYPLYPYLIFERLKKKPHSSTEDIISFVMRYQDSPLSHKMSRHWLNHLIRQKRWGEFIVFYDVALETGYKPNTALRCHQGEAFLLTNDKAQAFKAAKDLWMVGQSQHKACDNLFKAWLKSPEFNPSYYWQRAQLALKARKFKFANYLGRQLDKTQQNHIKTWAKYCQKPHLLSKKNTLNLKDPFNQGLVSHCLKRLAEKDRYKAIETYTRYEKHLPPTSPDTREFLVHLARYLSYYHDPEGPEWLEKADPEFQDHLLIERRMRYVLADQNWKQIIKHIKRMPEELRTKNQWQYWYARAFQELSKPLPKGSSREFKALMTERSYYGLLASRLANKPFSLNQNNRETDALKIEYISSHPGIRRTRELYAIDRVNEANREWFHTIKRLSEDDRGLAAELAHVWGWHYHAIVAAAKSSNYNHLIIRFPTPHQDLVSKYTDTFGIQPDWAYSVMRQESAFRVDARSRVGARGLMQLMPKTAKFVARQHKLSYRNASQLVDPKYNIKLGTRYLADLYEEFEGNLPAATAAYNAGPSRSHRWIAKHPDLPTDLWIETIPIEETREYVKNIQTYRAIYQAHLAENKLAATQYAQRETE